MSKPINQLDSVNDWGSSNWGTSNSDDVSRFLQRMDGEEETFTFKPQNLPNPTDTNTANLGANNTPNPFDNIDEFSSDEEKAAAFLASQKADDVNASDPIKQFTLLGEDPITKEQAAALLAEEAAKNSRGTNNVDSVDTDNGTEFSTQDYQRAYDIVKEFGFDIIPDDKKGEITPELFIQLKEADQQRRTEEAYNRLLSSAADDSTRRILEVALEGGSIEDVLYIKDKQETIQSLATLDVSTEENQREILTQWLSEGLDPKNPAHKYRLDNVERDVEKIIADYDGPTKSEEARTYFVQKEQADEQTRLKAIQDGKAAQEAEQLQRAQKAQDYRRSLEKTIKESSWSEKQKEQVLDTYFNSVELEDGRQVPLWYYKHTAIAEDPKLFQHYLDFLAGYDLETNSFTKVVTPNVAQVNKAVNQSLLDFVKKAGAAGNNNSKSGDFSTPPNQSKEVKWRF
jgi:hypothetical protein